MDIWGHLVEEMATYELDRLRLVNLGTIKQRENTSNRISRTSNCIGYQIPAEAKSMYR